MTSEPPVQDWRLSPVQHADPPVLGAPRGTAAPPDDRVARRDRPKRPKPDIRVVAFVVALVLLISAVPALTWAGLQLIRNSRSGHFVDSVTDRRAPGYEALVDPTPTAIVLQKDRDGRPFAAAVMALGAADGGGSMMFVPMSTQVSQVIFGVDRMSAAYRSGGDRNVVGQIERLLNLDLADTISIEPGQWAALTRPVEPLELVNPDRVGTGRTTFPPGRLALRADEVADYLQATAPGESELNRLNRQELFWQSWLTSIGGSTDPAVVPGEAASGLGYYTRTLGRGHVTFEQLPLRAETNPASDRPLVVDADALRATAARMVPFPAPPSPGSRVTVRLLNGVNGNPVPAAVANRLVLAGGTISRIGNDRRFGQDTSTFVYREDGQRAKAASMRAALGGAGTLRKDVRATDAVDVTVIIGQKTLADLADDPTTTQSTTRGSTALGG